MNEIVCFTGHRTIKEAEYPTLSDALFRVIEELIQSGATEFRTGGAIGFDTLAALTVLNLRKKYPQIRLCLILPCPTQPQEWRREEAELYRQILHQADNHRYVSEIYYNGVLQMRNRRLVEGADVCVAFLRSSHGGGTAFTVSQALKKGLTLINLADFC